MIYGKGCNRIRPRLPEQRVRAPRSHLTFPRIALRWNISLPVSRICLGFPLSGFVRESPLPLSAALHCRRRPLPWRRSSTALLDPTTSESLAIHPLGPPSRRRRGGRRASRHRSPRRPPSVAPPSNHPTIASRCPSMGSSLRSNGPRRSPRGFSATLRPSALGLRTEEALKIREKRVLALFRMVSIAFLDPFGFRAFFILSLQFCVRVLDVYHWFLF